MTVDVIGQASSRTYTATIRGQSFVISNNSGQFASITGLTVSGRPSFEPGIGPNPERRTIGPLVIGDTFTVTADLGQVLVEYDGAASESTTSEAFVAPSNNGVLGAIDAIQAAHDLLLSRGGGTLKIAPRAPGSAKYIWDKTFFWDQRVRLPWMGKGVIDFVMVDHFPLASYRYRDKTTGVVAVRPIDQRCAIYVIPYAPFDPRGTVITPSSEGVQGVIEGFSLDGNKVNQDGEVAGIYAPIGKSDPNWPYVAGAFSVDQVANPGGGTINLSADAQAYYGFRARGVDIYNTSGTQFVSLADRQRTHLLEECRGTGGGVNNGDGSVLYLSRGFDLQGNDSWVFGGGWGNNNAMPQGNQQSGMLAQLNNFFINKGADGSHVVRALSINGHGYTGNVVNGLAVVSTPQANPIAARGGSFVGNQFLWTDGQMSGGRPKGVSADADDAYLQYSGFRQVASVGNIFSVATDGSTPKYHVSALNGSGCFYAGTATTEPTVQSYSGASPWFTDATGGVVGGSWLDPYTSTLHIGVSWKGLLSGPNLANTQFVQCDSPFVPAAGIVGRSDGAAPPVGFLGEPGAANGTAAALTTGVDTDIAQLVLIKGEYDVYAEVVLALGAISVAAAQATFECSISATSAMDRSSPRGYAPQFLPIPAGGASGQALCSLRVGPLRASLSANQTYHLVVRGSNLSINTVSVSGAIHSRRW